MKKFVAYILATLILTACSAPTPDAGQVQSLLQTALAGTSEAIAMSVTATDTVVPTNTPAPTSTPGPTNTPRPTNTSIPTATTTPTPDRSHTKAKNYLASLDEIGVTIEIARILIAEKTSVDQDFSSSELFSDKPVVVEIVFKVTNTTNEVATVYVDQGTIAVNGEQIDLFDYALTGARFGDDLGGEILPGVTKIGGIWVGVKRSTFEEINQIIIKISRARTDSGLRGKDYNFTIEVGDWGFEEYPKELE